MKNLKWILAGLLVLSWVFKSSAAAPDVFSSINVELAAAVQAEPLSLKVTDVATFRSLSDAQLAALIKVLAATPTIAMDDLPNKGVGGTYYSLQHPEWPPLPGDTSFSPAWIIASTGAIDKTYLLSDLDFVYGAPAKSKTAMRAMSPSGFEGDGFELPNTYSMMCYASNILCLEIISVDLTNQVADLLLHNTTNSYFYQLLSKTNLLQPVWTLGTIQDGASGTNQTDFFPVNLDDNPMMFFWAHQADWKVSVVRNADAVEPHGNDPGQLGSFILSGNWVSGVTNDLKVYYRIGGTASNGVDYTFLNGVATLTNNNGYAEIKVLPSADNLAEGSETVTLTLVPTNTYLISAADSSATNFVFDAFTTVSFAVPTDGAIEPNGPPGAPAVPAVFRFTVPTSDPSTPT